jgi:hypothetical protein
MNGQGAKVWEELTGRAYTQKSNIAIVLGWYALFRTCVLYRANFRW